MTEHIELCAICKEAELPPFDIPQGSEFGMYWHCPKCVKEFPLEERDEEIYDGAGGMFYDSII